MTGGGNTIKVDDVMALYKAMQSKAASAQLKEPRVGGISKLGVWVGKGAGAQGKLPRSALCMREFKADPIKNHQAMFPIEDKCQRGLRDSPDKYFCLQHESNADKIVEVLYDFREQMIHCGMESVFQIVKSDHGIVNMLESPGMVDDKMIKTWFQDLLVDGVHGKDINDASIRLDVCKYDETNLSWSGQAVLNSCSDALRQDLKLKVTPSKHTGPQLMMALLNKFYRPSQAKIRKL